MQDQQVPVSGARVSQVFLSCAEEDQDDVAAVARWLRDEAGVGCWFAPWQLIPGEDPQRQMEDALLESQVCAVFVRADAGAIVGWHDAQMRVAIQTRVEDRAGYRVIPVLLPGRARPPRSALPPFLRRHTPVELRALDDPHGLRLLLAGILGVPPQDLEGQPPHGRQPQPTGAPQRPPPAYHTLTLTFYHGGDGALLLAGRGPGGSALAHGVPAGADAALDELVGRQRLGALDRRGARDLGERLFRTLTAGPLRDLYIRSQALLGPDERLRLVVEIAPEDAALAALPWELLFDPDQGHLALLGASVVRAPALAQALPPRQIPGRMRVLLSAAHTPPPVPVARELAAARAALAAGGPRFEIVEEPHLTADALRRHLREGLHLWHFVGHGAGAAGAQPGALLFEDAAGDPHPIDAPQLGGLLSRSGVQLVLLSACDAGLPAADQLDAVATALVSAQVPAVVAMQFPVPAEATRSFVAELLAVLAQGMPLELGVSEGRKALLAMGADRTDWATPVLYARGADAAPPDPASRRAPF